MSATSGQSAEDELTGLVVVTAVVAVLLVQVGRFLTVGGLFSDGLYIDPDAYMWFNRVEALIEGRGWLDHTEPRVNPPEGHEQHWTRPLDMLLLAGGWVLSGLFGFRDGLALWGNLISPLLMFVAAWGVYRLARLLVAPRQAAVAAAVFMVQPAILLTFSWGRPDHHALLRLGQVLFLLAFVRFFLSEQHRRGWSFVAGWIGAWAVWVNIEALGFVLVGLITLGLWWLLVRRDLAEANVAFSGGLFAGVAAAVAIERGPEFFSAYPIDTIGFPYVVLFGLTWLFWVGIWAWTRYGPEAFGWVGRAGAATVLAAGVLGGLALVEPSFFAGPFGQVDELYRQVRLQRLNEQLPALHPVWHSPVAVVGRVLSLFGILLVGLRGFARKIRGEDARRVRWMWGMLAAMATAYAVLALDTVRWSAYLPAAAAVGFAVVGGWFLDWLNGWRTGVLARVVRPLGVVVLVVGLPLAGGGLQEAGHWLERQRAGDDAGPAASGAVPTGERRCDLREAVGHLEKSDDICPEALVAIDPDRASELLYRTDHSVLAMANHRPQPGFTLFFEAMSATEMSRAHEEFADRGVEAVVVCPGETWPSLRDDGRTVAERLGAGEPGEGFRPVAGAEDAGGWWVYAVEANR